MDSMKDFYTPLKGCGFCTINGQNGAGKFPLTHLSRGVTALEGTGYRLKTFLLTHPSRDVTMTHLITHSPTKFLLTHPSRGVTATYCIMYKSHLTIKGWTKTLCALYRKNLHVIQVTGGEPLRIFNITTVSPPS